MRWRPSLGAWREGRGTRFRVWAPEAARLVAVLEPLQGPGTELPLQKAPDGFFEGWVEGVGAGDPYRYRVDGQGPYPDPASRSQPRGVHGPSQIVDPFEFPWTDHGWTGIPMEDLVLYELHVGTFTPEGSFAAAEQRLSALRDLGVTGVELMPLADFPGQRNWGYDGVALFAPARCYGTPDDLRRFVDRAHRLGLAVLVDVVYNHFGPDGAYQSVFSPHYYSERHKSPWGQGINFDGRHSAHVRAFFIENALHWIHEHHVDGLRLDATHAIVDESPRHFLAELSAAVRASMEGEPRQALVIAEDTRNLGYMLKPESEGGWGLDGAWSDDFHHQMRRGLAGDSDGYFQDFAGSLEDIAATVRKGWFYCGQYAPYFGAPRGTDPAGVPPPRFVFFLQNHDQVGNRAFGERLHHQIDPAVYRAATALLLLAPQTPLLFMGQEWAASTPFQFFTDHHEQLGRLVSEGRRREFSRFAAFADPASRERIPDPQDLRTFQASRLVWEERDREPHASSLRLHQRLLALRWLEPALRMHQDGWFQVAVLHEETLLLRRSAPSAPALLVVIRFRRAGTEDLREHPLARAGGGSTWELLMSTEEPGLAHEPAPAFLDPSGPVVEFRRPGAVVLKERTL